MADVNVLLQRRKSSDGSIVDWAVNADGSDPVAQVATSGVATHSANDVAVAGASVVVLAANAARKAAMIQNTGAATMRVTLDNSAATATHGIQVLPGQSLLLSQGWCPVDNVRAIREGGTSTTCMATEVV